MGFDPYSGVDCCARLHRALGRASLYSGNMGGGFRLARSGDRKLDADICSSPIQYIRRVYHHVPGQLDVLLQRDSGSCVGEKEPVELIDLPDEFGLVARAAQPLGF